MCNSLFPVRAAVFAIQLAKIPEVVNTYNVGCRGIPLGEEDGLTRMVLSSPGVGNAIRKHVNLKDFRARLAFTGDSPGFGRGMNVPLFEVYDTDGKFISSTRVSELNTELSDAVCIEIQHVLLISKGIDVNMY